MTIGLTAALLILSSAWNLLTTTPADNLPAPALFPAMNLRAELDETDRIRLDIQSSTDESWIHIESPDRFTDRSLTVSSRSTSIFQYVAGDQALEISAGNLGSTTIVTSVHVQTPHTVALDRLVWVSSADTVMVDAIIERPGTFRTLIEEDSSAGLTGEFETSTPWIHHFFNGLKPDREYRDRKSVV